MTTLAVMAFLTLAGIAALHVAWGCGVHWPLRNERDLVALVIGQTGRTRMPGPAECLLAAAAILSAGVLALLLASLVSLPLPPALVTAAGAAATLVFSARAIAAYTYAWRWRFSQEPFATMDRGWYAPLCFMLAVVFAMLVIKRVVS